MLDRKPGYTTSVTRQESDITKPNHFFRGKEVVSELEIKVTDKAGQQVAMLHRPVQPYEAFSCEWWNEFKSWVI